MPARLHLQAQRFDLQFVAAGTGNVLGSCLNWALGRYLHHLSDRRWFPFSAMQLHRASDWYNRYGLWSLLFAALSLPPTRLVRSSWPWRSALYLAGGALPGVPAIVLLLRYGIEDPAPVLLAAVSTLVAGVIVFGRLERWRLRLVDSVPLPDAHRPLPRRGWRYALRVRLREQVTWREIGFTGISIGVLCWLDAVVLACMVGYPVAAVLSPLYERDGRTLTARRLAGPPVPHAAILPASCRGSHSSPVTGSRRWKAE